MEELRSALLSALVAAVPVLAAALFGLVSAALVALTRKLSAQAGESQLAQVASRASMVAEAVVRDIEVSLRPKLLAATADGLLTPAEWAQLKAAAMTDLRASLGGRGLEELAAGLRLSPDGLTAVLSGLIEAAVAKMQGESGGAVSFGPVELGPDAVRALLEKADRTPPSSSSAPTARSSLAALVLLLPLAGLLGQGCTPLHARRPDVAAPRAELQVPQADWRPVATDAQCAAWDSSRLTWGVVGTVSGALGAAGGGVALLGDLVGDSRGAQLALGITSLLLGALTVGAEYAQDGLMQRYSVGCTVPAQVPEGR